MVGWAWVSAATRQGEVRWRDWAGMLAEGAAESDLLFLLLQTVQGNNCCSFYSFSSSLQPELVPWPLLRNTSAICLAAQGSGPGGRGRRALGCSAAPATPYASSWKWWIIQLASGGSDGRSRVQKGWEDGSWKQSDVLFLPLCYCKLSWCRQCRTQTLSCMDPEGAEWLN